jgi:hypothetical protein
MNTNMSVLRSLMGVINENVTIVYMRLVQRRLRHEPAASGFGVSCKSFAVPHIP